MPHRSMPPSSASPPPRRATWRECLVVLGPLGVAALCTAVAAILGIGMEIAAPLWLAAVLWTVPSSLALALRRGLRDGDWSAFRYRGCDRARDDLLSWSTRTGAYAYLRVAEEHERLMRSD